MRKCRRLPSEGLVQQDLPRGIRNVVLAPHDVRNLHQRIVDDHGVVVGGDAFGTNEHRIAEHVGVESNLSAHEIVPDDLAVVRNAEPNGRGLAVLSAPSRLVGRDVAASPRVLGGPPLAQRVVAVHLELLGRTEASIRLAPRHQLDNVRAVDMEALRLAIGTVVAAPLHPLIPAQTHPLEVLEDGRLGFARGPRDVGILDSEHERAARPACEQPIEEGRPRVADMQLTRGTGGETDSHADIVDRFVFRRRAHASACACPRRLKPPLYAESRMRFKPSTPKRPRARRLNRRRPSSQPARWSCL